nr:helix-turn-helix transcriptional regulator [uncultured Peptostreptococcus sp.]
MQSIMELDSFDMDIDYRALCESLARGNMEAAVKEFERMVKDWVKSENIIVYRAFLNSLIYAIYYYILFTYNKSLKHCCYHCTILMHKKITSKNFLETTKMILDQYYDDMLEHKVLGVNPALKSVFAYIDENIHRPISLEEVSEYAHINKSYLSQIFKQNTGYTFSSYVNYRKLNRARKLLLHTEKNIAVISQECGYRNVSYFSTVFTKTVGISPGLFRKTGSAFKISLAANNKDE